MEQLSFLEKLTSENQYPIVFIGSGITKRYFKNAPSWADLLERLWMMVHPDTNFYNKLGLLKSLHNNSNYAAYLYIATQLEDDFKNAFFEGKIEIANLTPRNAAINNISPLKQEISNIFFNLGKIDDRESELKALKQMLIKSRLIITTNYDMIIEDLLSNKIKVNVGGKSLFSKTDDFNELFKIHGSIDQPNSIVITNDDYIKSEQTSTLVNAKILSNLIDSPILFFGYSLTDENVLSLLTDLSHNMPDNLRQSANRIGVVDYKSGEQSIIETKSEISDLNVHYTKLETDNYEKIYNNISKINQGLSPNEISKYSSAFKKIIQVKGKAAELDTVLTSFIDLDKLPENLNTKNIVVAFGDARYIYKMPQYADYIETYFCDNEDFPLEIALSFLEKYPAISTLPIVKFIKLANTQGFDHSTIKNISKLREQIVARNNRWTLQSLINEVKIPKKHSEYLHNMVSKNPYEIFTDKDSLILRTKILYITKHIKRFSITDLQSFTEYLLKNHQNIIGRTEFRKFFFAYSLILDDTLVNLN